jgi:Glycoside Hydrolase Family 113
MKRSPLILCAAATLWLGVGAVVCADSLPAAKKQKGMSYAAWSAGAYSQPDSDVSLEHLAETGATWIALVVTCYQDNLASTRIAANETTPADAGLIHVISQAHDLGLKVMLKPHLDLAKDPAHWRGEIGRAYTTEAQWADWFASYRSFIEHYADLASTYGADQFCVGTELEGTTQRAADWRNIIAAVRTRYAGPLIYAANHSGEEQRLTWWDAVDFIGVDAYYPLANRTDPTLAELKSAWQTRVAVLAALAARWQKPIILTEIGYRSIDGAAMHPWDYQITGKIDLKEQADCYRAALESVYGQPWFAGIYWWAWSPDPRQGGAADDNYTPHGKPAEDIVTAWYQSSKPGEEQHRRRPPGLPIKDPAGRDQ